MKCWAILKSGGGGSKQARDTLSKIHGFAMFGWSLAEGLV